MNGKVDRQVSITSDPHSRIPRNAGTLFSSPTHQHSSPPLPHIWVHCGWWTVHPVSAHTNVGPLVAIPDHPSNYVFLSDFPKII